MSSASFGRDANRLVASRFVEGGHRDVDASGHRDCSTTRPHVVELTRPPSTVERRERPRRRRAPRFRGRSDHVPAPRCALMRTARAPDRATLRKKALSSKSSTSTTNSVRQPPWSGQEGTRRSFAGLGDGLEDCQVPGGGVAAVAAGEGDQPRARGVDAREGVPFAVLQGREVQNGAGRDCRRVEVGRDRLQSRNWLSSWDGVCV